MNLSLRKELVKTVGLEAVLKAEDLTEAYNHIVESEFLYKEDGKIIEKEGYMRRGLVLSGENKTAEPFERESWPTTSRNLSSDIAGFSWSLVYETAPDFESSGQVAFGYTFEKGIKDPFFFGLSHHTAKRRGKTFKTIFDQVDYLRECMSGLDYRRGE